ncbi:Histidine--tRNA ligase [compost metagenome]
MLELLKEQGNVVPALVPDIYAIVPSVAALPLAMSTAERLRTQGVKVQMHAAPAGGDGMGSMKSQFKKADASGAVHALIFGEDELSRGMVTLKSLRDGAGAQSERALDALADWAPHLQSIS